MTTIPGLEPTNTRDTCRCGAPITHTHDDPHVAGLPITIDTQPTTPTAALTAIINGQRVVYTSTYKRDRGAGTAKDHRRWRPPQFALDFDQPLHVEHQCGITHPPPPPPPAPAWPDATTPPPF